MNDHDRNNLNFLLSIDAATFEDWLDQCDMDDVEYALELLAMHRQERALEACDEVLDLSEAREVLAKIAKLT